jgi:lysozyme
MMKINKAGLDLIKEFEGLRLKAYKDPVGIVTIGYGTTAAAEVGIIPRMGMTITQAEAEYYLEKGVNKFAAQIEPSIFVPINNNEFAAYVSLAYNIGPGAFKKSSSLRHFNNLDKAKAAQNILLWNKAGGKVLNGLVRRRASEKKLFEAPVVQVKPEKVAKTQNVGIIAAIAAFIAFIFGVKK